MADQIQPIAQGPNGEPIYNNATPGFGGAILDAIKALAMAVSPRSITQAPGRRAMQERAAEGGPTVSQAPQTSDLGNQF